MDFAALLAALGDDASADPSCADADALGPSTLDLSGADADCDGGPAGEEAVLAALEQGAEPLPAGAVAARVAERLAPGPDLVAWLALAPAADQAGYDLDTGMRAWGKIAAWAQSQQLAHIAQTVSRAAQRDPNIEVGLDGRPARVPASAEAEVSLALAATSYSAGALTDLAVDLQWRLAATGAALATGQIDLPRARLIAQHTAPLTDTAAQAVEARVLPAAGRQTTTMLRDALHRAVLAVDPDGAQRRRQNAERHAKVNLYPEHDGTATLTAQGLPAVSAAAARARITALARAMKAAGSAGGLDFLRAQVFLGLLLGTLPLIPPAPGAPPDIPPDDDPPTAGPAADPPSTGPADNPPSTGPAGGSGTDPHGGTSGGPGTGPTGGPSAGPGENPGSGGDGGPWDGFPDPRDEDAPEDTGDDPADGESILTGKYRPDSSYRPGPAPPGETLPDLRDDDWLETGPTQRWPDLPASIPPGLAAPGPAPPGMSRPVSGLLDVSVPWQTLTGLSAEPGYLGRIGPVTASDTRRLADCAARDPTSIWRIIVTNRAGQALAVTRMPRRRAGRTGEPPGPRPGDGIGLIGRITLTIPEDILDGDPPLPGPDAPGILLRAFRYAEKALAQARADAQADAAGGCAHRKASKAYVVPPRLRDYITARDLTCRFLTCRQPVWCCDIDHTQPYDKGGRTCKCNNGGLCRTHHQIKQLPGWTLHQPSPGIFRWTTPNGRTYTATPDIHPV